MKKLKIAILGYGGIARLHYAAYRRLMDEGIPVDVVAVCEKNKDSVFKNVSINLGGNIVSLDEKTSIYSDVDELIQCEDFDIADVCLPTFLHKAMSEKLLLAGKHVLCEKPMALNSNECREMVDAATKADRLLMIGQCVRFSPLFRFLKRCIDDGRFGKLKFLELYRLCDYPRWGSDFGSIERTGGCILDTHIHDVDVVRYLLGSPKEVSGYEYVDIPRCQLADTRMYYDDLTVRAIASWDETREVSFASGFHARFESADLISDGNKLKILEPGEKKYFADIENKDMIEEEIRAFICAVMRGEKCVDNTPESSMMSVKTIEAIKASANMCGEKIKIDF